MGFAKFLVPVTGGERDARVLETAFAAAKPFEAHVEALFVHSDPREVTAQIYSGVPIAPEVVQGIIDGQKQLTQEFETAARSTLIATAKDVGADYVAAPSRANHFSCSFRSRLGFVPHAVARAVRLADVAVFAPFSAEQGPEMTSAFLETLTNVGRPAILSPMKPVQTFAQSIAIGWDGGTAAAHAITTALPYLKRAAEVEILVVNQGSHVVDAVGELKTYLALHSVTAETRNIEGDHRNVGETLIEAAASHGADLLVMGGYGHGHLRETILGGVTRHVVSHATLPVFLMH
jgi:nucleotide-binding universal stress UspA family protein